MKMMILCNEFYQSMVKQPISFIKTGHRTPSDRIQFCLQAKNQLKRLTKICWGKN